MITLAEFMDKADDHRLDESRFAKAMYTAGALASAAAGAFAGYHSVHGHVDSSGKSHVQTQADPAHKATEHYFNQNYEHHGGGNDGMRRYREAVKRAEAERKK